MKARVPSGPVPVSDSALPSEGTFITKCRNGLSLDEIRVLFHGFGSDVPPPARWQEIAIRKLQELDEQATRIERMRRVLHATLACGCVTLEDCARETDAVL